MTTSTQASEALDRLREVVEPGEMVRVVDRGRTRSGNRRITVHAQRQNITAEVTIALGLRPVSRGCIGLTWPGTTRETAVADLADRLSTALFGEPGQIKGEYL